MLVSHRKKFIFTKTLKTAGTSVEAYFERYCMPEGTWEKSHTREEHVSPAGIIGFRGALNKHATFYNHMPAKEIKDKIGARKWDQYFKFTTIRNPFEKILSLFSMFYEKRKGYTLKKKVKAGLRRILNLGNPIDRLNGETDIELFRDWIMKGGAICDNNKYFIDGKLCVDYFIRFENLEEDLEHVCNEIGVPFNPELLPHFKKRKRKQKYPTYQYYDKKTRKIIEELYDWEMKRFSYNFPKPADEN